VVVEQNRELAEKLRKQGMAAVSGNAADPAVLIQAHIAEAAMLLVATPDPLNVRHALQQPIFTGFLPRGPAMGRRIRQKLVALGRILAFDAQSPTGRSR